MWLQPKSSIHVELVPDPLYHQFQLVRPDPLGLGRFEGELYGPVWRSIVDQSVAVKGSVLMMANAPPCGSQIVSRDLGSELPHNHPMCRLADEF